LAFGQQQLRWRRGGWWHLSRAERQQLLLREQQEQQQVQQQGQQPSTPSALSQVTSARPTQSPLLHSWVALPSSSRRVGPRHRFERTDGAAAVATSPAASGLRALVGLQAAGPEAAEAVDATGAGQGLEGAAEDADDVLLAQLEALQVRLPALSPAF
jgi:hypothetical protein